ncbi:MAG: DUF4238 domain-containing protein [Roseiarcus sp.]
MCEKNHFIPKFYQKRWEGDDKKVCVYFRNAIRVQTQRRHRSSVGYAVDLYTVPGVDLAVAAYLERQFFRITDDLAANALAIIERGPWTMNAHTRSGWTRFIVSLLHRNPEQIARSLETVSRFMVAARPLYEREYDLRKDANHPPAFEEFWKEICREVEAKTWINLVQTTIDSEEVGNHFNNLIWRVFDLHGSQTLLTGDRPIIMTNGMVNPDSHLSIPIGPKKLFVAATRPEFLDFIQSQSADEIASLNNDLIVRQARRFCIGVDDSHLELFSERFGEMRASSAVEEVPLPTEDELRQLYLTSTAKPE